MRPITIFTGLLAAVATAAARSAQLSPELHRELLLGGQPHIGLWQALLKQEEARVHTKDLL